ncbi:MAG: hypothetical protein NT113_23300 [Hyphomicrobiales bacterium]|nr:hypothetical protein [Hyphomicrobiales bacterium]
MIEEDDLEVVFEMWGHEPPHLLIATEPVSEDHRRVAAAGQMHVVAADDGSPAVPFRGQVLLTLLVDPCGSRFLAQIETRERDPDARCPPMFDGPAIPAFGFLDPQHTTQTDLQPLRRALDLRGWGKMGGGIAGIETMNSNRVREIVVGRTEANYQNAV